MKIKNYTQMSKSKGYAIKSRSFRKKLLTFDQPLSILRKLLRKINSTPHSMKELIKP